MADDDTYTAEWYDGNNGPFQQPFTGRGGQESAEAHALAHGGDVIELRDTAEVYSNDADANRRGVPGTQEVTGVSDVERSNVIAQADTVGGANANEPERFGGGALGSPAAQPVEGVQYRDTDGRLSTGDRIAADSIRHDVTEPVPDENGTVDRDEATGRFTSRRDVRDANVVDNNDNVRRAAD